MNRESELHLEKVNETLQESQQRKIEKKRRNMLTKPKCSGNIKFHRVDMTVKQKESC